jgi:hypothetical protein
METIIPAEMRAKFNINMEEDHSGMALPIKLKKKARSNLEKISNNNSSLFFRLCFTLSVLIV